MGNDRKLDIEVQKFMMDMKDLCEGRDVKWDAEIEEVQRHREAYRGREP